MRGASSLLKLLVQNGPVALLHSLLFLMYVLSFRSGWQQGSLLANLRSLLTVAYSAQQVALFIIRRPSVQRRVPLLSALAAILGSYLPMLFGLLPTGHTTTTALIAGDSLVFIGLLWNILSICYLGRSFGLMADARRLVTRGTYAIVRHPMYLGYTLIQAGFLLPAITLASALGGFAWLGIQLARIYYEERVLASVFPEYRAYQMRTRRLIPGIW